MCPERGVSSALGTGVWHATGAQQARRGYYVCSFEAVKFKGDRAIDHVVIALGSNIGAREEHLAAGRRGLERLGLKPLLASGLHETAAVGGPAGQGSFLNQVVAAQLTPGVPGPRELLEACLQIEASRGRVRRVRWGPRTLDLDIVLYGPRVIDDAGLRVPHPRLAERLFVLRPLCEILPHAHHPEFGRTMRELLAALEES